MTKRRSVDVPPPPPPDYTPPILPKPETPHPKVTERTAQRIEQRELLLPGIDDGPRYIAYGQQRLSGKLQWVHYQASLDVLWGVIELCAGESEELLGVRRVDEGDLPPKGTYWNYWWYPGTPAGEVNPNLVSAKPTWNEAFPGTCYVVVRFLLFGRYWGGKIPNLVWHMKTRKCLSASSGLYVYSENVWDQWYDFVRWSEGKQLPATRVDATSFVAAKAADAASSRKAASHLLLMDESSPDDVIETFRLMARAWWFWESDKFRVVPDRPGSAIALWDDAAWSDAVPLEFDHLEVNDRPNKVTILYTDRSNGWQLTPYSYPEEDPAGDIIEEEQRLPHLHDPAQVKELAIWIYKSRVFGGRVRGRARAQHLDRQLGDIITVQNEARGIVMPARLIVRQKLPDNTAAVELYQHDDEKFTTSDLTVPPRLESELPNVAALPPDVDVDTVTWSEELFEVPGGDELPRGVLSFEMPVFPYLQHVEVWISYNGGPSRYWFSTASVPVTTPVLFEAGVYTLRFRSRQRLTQELTEGSQLNVEVTGAQLPTGPPGTSGVGFVLTNEAHVVPTDSAGSNGDFAGAEGQVQVLVGSVDDTASATFLTPIATHCSGTVNNGANTPVAGKPKGYYRVTAMSQDVATLDIPILYGSVSVTLRFSLSKSRQGASGGKSVSVIVDRQIVTYNGEGELAPAEQPIMFVAHKNNIDNPITWSLTRTDGTPLDAATYLSATTGDVVTMTAAQFSAARGATKGVIVTASAIELV